MARDRERFRDSNQLGPIEQDEPRRATGTGSGLDADTLDGADGADYLDRANHTGTQPASTISDFTTQVNALIQNVVGAAPAALDTLVELSAALGNDPNFAATLNSALSTLGGRVTTLETNQGSAAGYATNVGDGTATVFTVTHNRNSLDVAATVRRTSDGQLVYPVIKCTGVNTCTVDFGTTVPATNAYRVLVGRVA